LPFLGIQAVEWRRSEVEGIGHGRIISRPPLRQADSALKSSIPDRPALIQIKAAAPADSSAVSLVHELASSMATFAEGPPMDADLTQRILRDPRYQELKAKRSRFGWWLTLAMMLVYYGFILLVAFDKPFLATRLGAGVTTVGMPLGLAVIVFTIVITGLYVRRANSEYDALTEQITKAALK
jgi:uncharacterized membrane protein (DUF485 family)